MLVFLYFASLLLTGMLAGFLTACAWTEAQVDKGAMFYFTLGGA